MSESELFAAMTIVTSTHQGWRSFSAGRVGPTTWHIFSSTLLPINMKRPERPFAFSREPVSSSMLIVGRVYEKGPKGCNCRLARLLARAANFSSFGSVGSSTAVEVKPHRLARAASFCSSVTWPFSAVVRTQKSCKGENLSEGAGFQNAAKSAEGSLVQRRRVGLGWFGVGLGLV